LLPGAFGRFPVKSPKVSIHPLLPVQNLSMPVNSGELSTFPVTSRGFNRHPVIGYYTTGVAGEFRAHPVIIPPAGETILPHPVIGTSSKRTKSGNTTLPEVAI
jgi:hypothetical protein